MPNPTNVGRQIQVLRKDKGMTQVQLAECLKISFQSVSKWENGKALPVKPLLTDIAMILESSIEFLLRED